MTDRPDREVIRAMVFDEGWALRPGFKLQRAYCDRKGHTIAEGIKTAFGWWMRWRVPRSESGERWEYDWADEVTAYTEATCHCGRARDIQRIVATLR